MKLKFRLMDYDFLREDLEELFNQITDFENTEEQKGYVLGLTNYRIVVPRFRASFREGTVFRRNPEVKDPDAEDAWDTECSAYVKYGQNEKDVNGYIYWMNTYTEEFVEELANESDFDGVDPMNCRGYIDLSEFLDDETAKQLFESCENHEAYKLV